jgi:DNA invertase Pin-like site-specific DNA recombinase
MANVAYIRVSTIEQNIARQLDGLQFDRIFEDKVSGSTINRAGLNELQDYVREGDVIHVHDISRMARNVGDLIKLIRDFNQAGVSVHFHKESLIFTGEDSPMNSLMLTLLGAVYQFEREMILERQREGITKAKQAGKYKGRKKTLDNEKIKVSLDAGVSIRRTVEALEISVSSVQRVCMLT